MDDGVRALRDRGWAVLPAVVDPTLLAPLFDEIDRELGGEPGAAWGPQPRRRSAANGWDDRWLDPVLHTRAFWHLATSPRLTDALAPFLGETIAYQDNGHLRCHPPRPLEPLPWHQDAQFYGVGTEQAARQMLTVWIPLVDAPVEAGCMAAVGGSHRWGLLPGAVPSATSGQSSTRTRQEQIYASNSARVRGEEVTLIPLRRGDVMVFSNLLVHTGTENRSEGDRWSLDLRFEAPLGSRPVDAEEEEGLRLMHRRLAGRGSRPLLVRGPDGPTTFEQWRSPVGAPA